MSEPGIIEQVDDYAIREQGFREIHSDTEVQFTLCGINPYGYFENIRRFVAGLNGEIVGEGWTLTSRHSPWGRLGHYGMFADEHKRKGLGPPDRGAYPGVRTENLAAYEIVLREPEGFTHPYRIPWDY